MASLAKNRHSSHERRFLAFAIPAVLFGCASLVPWSAFGGCIGFSELPKRFLEARGASMDTRIRFIPAGAEGYLLQEEESCGLTGRCDSTLYLPDEKRCYREVLSVRGRWIEASGSVNVGRMGKVPSRLRIELDPPDGETEFRYDRKTGSYVESRERKKR
jgi:hypothetical protein